MGGNTSVGDISGNNANVNTGTQDNRKNLIGVTTANFSFASGSKSTVANATGKNLRIFYHKEEIKLEDVLVDSGTTKKLFKGKEEIINIDLPPNQHFEGPSFEDGYASVFVAAEDDGEVYVETVSLNYQVPYGACCIVTAKNEIAFRKSDGGVWIDEDGHDHRAQ